MKDNERVKTGQVLARIDDRDFKVALDQAKADVAAAGATIASKQAQLDVQQAVIDQRRRPPIDVDQAARPSPRRTNKRYTDLAASGYGSVQNAQQAQARIAERTGHAGARHRQSGIRAQAGRLLKAEIAQAKAALARAEAVQHQAELNLGYTTITAPIDGVVGNRTLRVGQYVQAGTQLMAVVPADGAYVVANYKETQLTDVQRGQAVDIEVDMFPGQVVHGHVDSIAPASGQEFALLPPDNATGNFTKVVQRIPVQIVLDTGKNPRVELRPGMSVDSRPSRRSSSNTNRAAAARRQHRTRRFPERRAMSNQSPSASISALPISRAASSPAADPNRASLTTWIAVLAAMIGAFMAILNIQITNASLLNIEGGIGTGVDNGAWISTSYLIGEIVVIPLTDYLSRVFSFRRYMLGERRRCSRCSRSPAPSPTISASMIAMRGLQGFAGGVLIPMAFTWC